MVDGVFCRDEALARHLEDQAARRPGARVAPRIEERPPETDTAIPREAPIREPDGTLPRRERASPPLNPPPNSEIAARPQSMPDSERLLQDRPWQTARPIPRLNPLKDEYDTLDAARTSVSDLMSSPVVSVVESTTVSEALKLLESSGCQHLPVVDPRGELVGIVSDKDLLGREGTVGPLATRRVLTATGDTALEEAAKALSHHRFHSLTVVDEKKRPIGIVTSSNLLRFLSHHPSVHLWFGLA